MKAIVVTCQKRRCLRPDPVTIIAHQTAGAAVVDVFTGSDCNILSGIPTVKAGRQIHQYRLVFALRFHAGIYPCRQT